MILGKLKVPRRLLDDPERPKLSYCTAERMEATRQVQHLEKSLIALEKQNASHELLQVVKDRLLEAQEKLRVLGDCGD